jgi:hypothetical protein
MSGEPTIAYGIATLLIFAAFQLGKGVARIPQIENRTSTTNGIRLLSYAEDARDSRTTDCPDVTDRLFDKRKKANVFRKQVRSGPCFLRDLL